jgi:hypothetical protein
MTPIAMTNALDDDVYPVRYDARHTPDPDAWLAMDESERLSAVLRHHDEDAPHAPAPAPDAHAVMHVVVETQIASGDPPATALTLKRLMAEGLSRHDAIHAVAGAVSRIMFDMMKRNVPFDPAAYDRELADLSASRWLASAAPPRDRARPQRRRRHPRTRR